MSRSFSLVIMRVISSIGYNTTISMKSSAWKVENGTFSSVSLDCAETGRSKMSVTSTNTTVPRWAQRDWDP